MINIGIYHQFTSAVSHYRVTTPLSLLRKVWKDIHLEFIIPGRTDIAQVENCDILLLSRPTTQNELNVIERAIIAGCKIWIDSDDDLYNLSIYNPGYYNYGKSQLDIYEKCLELADVVTVSTYDLFNQLYKYNPDIIPNAIIPDFKEPSKKTKDFKLAWRGSASHRMDLYLYRDVFLELAKKFKLHFFGWLPEFMYEHEVQYTNFMDLASFQLVFNQSDIDFVYFPLDKIPFNYAKSSISWLETTKAGAGFFTNLDDSKEFQYLGVGYDPIGLLNCTDSQLCDLKHTMYNDSKKVIEEQFNIYKINEKRKELILNLLK